MNVKKISIIGTGLMGKGIAHTFENCGYKVCLFGRRDNVKDELVNYFDNEVVKGRISEEQKNCILANIDIYNINSNAEKLADSDLVIESVKEDIQVKREIFEIVSKHTGSNTIVASNTSGYSITRLSEFTNNPHNFLGMHFFSPVPLMKLVEVARGEKTSVKVINTVSGLLKAVGKLPIEVQGSPGFVLNRGLALLINEAVHMYYQKIASSAEDIDNIFINGMNLKVGPLKLADLIGLDVVYMMMLNLYEGLNEDKYKPCSLLKDMLNSEKVGKKSGCGFYCY